MFCNAIVKLSRRRKLFELSPQNLGTDPVVAGSVALWSELPGSVQVSFLKRGARGYELSFVSI